MNFIFSIICEHCSMLSLIIGNWYINNASNHLSKLENEIKHKSLMDAKPSVKFEIYFQMKFNMKFTMKTSILLTALNPSF